jgi:CheY-like chemotaxis protein
MPFEATEHPESLRVLVADDNRDSATSMAKLIGLWGHNVQSIYTHHGAIDSCREFRPDVLLLDLGLPLRTDGLMVARTLREESARKDLVIAAVTGFEDDFTRDEAARAGIDYFFVKPVEAEVLKSFLSGVTATRHPATQ